MPFNFNGYFFLQKGHNLQNQSQLTTDKEFSDIIHENSIIYFYKANKEEFIKNRGDQIRQNKGQVLTSAKLIYVIFFVYRHNARKLTICRSKNRLLLPEKS